MKKFMMLLALTLVGFSSFASDGNEGPNAVPMPPPPPPPQVEAYLAQVTYGSFFTAPGAPFSTVVTINPNGSVIAVNRYHNSKETTEKLAQLSKPALKRLVGLVGKVQEGDLKDPNPSDPGCTDAPYTRYSVNKNGTIIDIAQQGACKELVRDNGSYVDVRIKELLAGFLSLAH